MIKNQLFIAAALFAGVAIGYFVKDAKSPEEAASEDRRYVAASKIGNEGEAASLKALRARIAELEKQLAEKDAEKPAEVAEEKVAGEQKAPPENSPAGRMREMREHMEWLKKEKPDEYKRLTEAMARWRQNRIERTHTKLDFLASIDTSTMTEEQKKNHEAYQDLLVRREELEEKMANPEMSDEDRADIMRDMFQTRHEMGQLAKQEQTTLIDQTVKALGYSGDDAAEVSATFQDILSVTETRGGPGGPPPGAGGPPPTK